MVCRVGGCALSELKGETQAVCRFDIPESVGQARERCILPAVDHTLAMLSGAKVFIKLNAISGFWQILLTDESALLTTFITPFLTGCCLGSPQPQNIFKDG